MPKYFILFILCASALYAVELSLADDIGPTPALVLFWRPDCLPCMHELDMLPQWSKKNPTLPIVLVSLVDAQTTQTILAKKKLPATIKIHIAQGGNEMTLAAWGDTKYVLPYSVFVTDNGPPCRSHIGLLGSDRIKTWIKQCKNTSSLPH